MTHGVTAHWSERHIFDQTGRTVLVTGANSGLGLRTARVLAARGARVLLACRSPERGADALRAVAEHAGTEPELVRLDLAELASVRDAAERVRSLTGDRLDVLVNNAGVMAPPKGKTKDGFETQFGINHLGHAALTWLLMPALRNAGTQAQAPARVVTLSSVAAHGASLGPAALADPHYEHRRYLAAAAYGQSKLANQAFALELHRRLTAAGDPVLSVAAHPGYSGTNLSSTMAGSRHNALVRGVMAFGTVLGDHLIAQNARMGALPSLYAATSEQVEGGDYVGPRGLGGVRGYPAKVRPLRAAADPEAGRALWELTAELTGVTPDPVSVSRDGDGA